MTFDILKNNAASRAELIAEQDGESSSKSLSDFRVAFTGPDHVLAAIANLGRTEDIRFSPDNNRLAVAAFARNRIVIFELSIEASGSEKRIIFTDITEISSPSLKEPHGIDFLDNQRIIVANRQGDVTIFGIPAVSGTYELAPIETISYENERSGPGNVRITRRSAEACEILVCQNYANQVIRHVIDLRNGCSVESSEVRISKWLSLPDGIGVFGHWIGISNHSSRDVLMYDTTRSAMKLADPDGILGYIRYPHGLRFTSDGRFILVADAGAPYVHIYRADHDGWRGVRKPLKSFRVMTEEIFASGRITVADGGPKGIDVNDAMSIFVTTSKMQPLVFFDLSGLLESLLAADGSATTTPLGSGAAIDIEQAAWEIHYELDRLPCASQEDLKHRIAELTGSRSWRYTAPARWALGLLKNCTLALSQSPLSKVHSPRR